MREKDQGLTDRYRKDESDEQFLNLLNARLTEFDESFYTKHPSPFPTIFILGVPRSGTTVVSQAISSFFDVGYVSNLMAAFWQAPVCGLRLTKKLLPKQLNSDFRSDFGRTEGMAGPHEFGYFWSNALRYKELYNSESAKSGPINWEQLAIVLRTISSISGKPFLHKNLLCNWHAEKLAEVVDNSFFVVVHRDPVDAALSLLDMREKFKGNRQAWASAKPAAYDDLAKRSPEEQVAGQVFYLNLELQSQLDLIAPDRIVRIGLENFCNHPVAVLEKLQKALETANFQLKNTGFKLPGFSYSELSHEKNVTRQQIANALEQFEAAELSNNK